jgi:hypothetical protein
LDAQVGRQVRHSPPRRAHQQRLAL